MKALKRVQRKFTTMLPILEGISHKEILAKLGLFFWNVRGWEGGGDLIRYIKL